jgi:beta-lactamase class A
MKKCILFFLLGSFFVCEAQEKIDKKLQFRIDTLCKNFNGKIGVYVKNLRTNQVAVVNADSVFPTASIVKVPIMLGIFDKINKGELTYHQSLQYRDSLLYAGEDILGSFKDSEHVELSKVLMLMLTTSDNTASLWLQYLADKGTRINAILDSNGYVHTRVNSRTPGRENNRTQFGWGQTTPREMANIFLQINNEKFFNKAACQKMKRLLSRQYWDEESISQVPPTVSILCKNGAVDASRSEVLLINSKGSSYIFSIFTKENKDISWNYNNEAWVLTRKLSSMLWNYFNPKEQWKPDVEEGKFR